MRFVKTKPVAQPHSVIQEIILFAETSANDYLYNELAHIEQDDKPSKDMEEYRIMKELPDTVLASDRFVATNAIDFVTQIELEKE